MVVVSSLIWVGLKVFLNRCLVDVTGFYVFTINANFNCEIANILEIFSNLGQ